MVTLIALAVLSIAEVGIAATDARQKPKPIIEDPIYTFFNGPPDSLAEMIVTPDLVLTGRMTRTMLRDIPNVNGARSYPASTHRFSVIEISRFAGLRPIPEEKVEVGRRSGDRDRGSYVERTVQVGFPEFLTDGGALHNPVPRGTATASCPRDERPGAV